MAKEINAGEQDIPQGAPVDIKATGDARQDDTGVIDAVEGPDAMAKANELAFMEEMVEVVVHDTTDHNAEPIVQVGVNGRMQFFLRGRPQTVRRKFVEALARCKPVGYTQTKQYDERTGHVSMRMNPHRALRYPFSVIKVWNRGGAAWLKKVLAEA